MEQQIGWIFVDASRTGLTKLFGAISTAEKANSERSASGCGKHVPDAVSDNYGGLNRGGQPVSCGEEKVRIGFGILDLVSRHDRYESRIDVERGEIDRGRFQAATGCDRPQDAGI